MISILLKVTAKDANSSVPLSTFDDIARRRGCKGNANFMHSSKSGMYLDRSTLQFKKRVIVVAETLRWKRKEFTVVVSLIAKIAKFWLKNNIRYRSKTLLAPCSIWILPYIIFYRNKSITLGHSRTFLKLIYLCQFALTNFKSLSTLSTVTFLRKIIIS